MSKMIEINFKELSKRIDELNVLLRMMNEPSFKKIEFWTDGVVGSGIVLENLISFCDDTIEFHNAVYCLIKRTIEYLNKIGQLEKADRKIADKL